MARALRILAYLTSTALYVAGLGAYFGNLKGLIKFVGLVPGTWLLLPIIGRGTLGDTIRVHAYYWWYWSGVLVISYWISSWLNPMFAIQDYARDGDRPPEWAMRRVEHKAAEDWKHGRCYSCKRLLDPGMESCPHCGAPSPIERVVPTAGGDLVEVMGLVYRGSFQATPDGMVFDGRLAQHGFDDPDFAAEMEAKPLRVFLRWSFFKGGRMYKDDQRREELLMNPVDDLPFIMSEGQMISLMYVRLKEFPPAKSSIHDWVMYLKERGVDVASLPERSTQD